MRCTELVGNLNGLYCIIVIILVDTETIYISPRNTSVSTVYENPALLGCVMMHTLFCICSGFCLYFPTLSCVELLYIIPMAKFSLCDSLSYSLALVLPKYSEHFIQAKLGDDMKQAMCEYRTHLFFSQPAPVLSSSCSYTVFTCFV